MTPDTREERQVEHEEATPRPWMFTGDIETWFRTVATDPYRDVNNGVSSATWEADAALIVESVNAYDRLRAIEAAGRAVDEACTPVPAGAGRGGLLVAPGQGRAFEIAAAALREALR